MFSDIAASTGSSSPLLLLVLLLGRTWVRERFRHETEKVRADMARDIARIEADSMRRLG